MFRLIGDDHSRVIQKYVSLSYSNYEGDKTREGFGRERGKGFGGKEFGKKRKKTMLLHLSTGEKTSTPGELSTRWSK